MGWMWFWLGVCEVDVVRWLIAGWYMCESSSVG